MKKSVRKFFWLLLTSQEQWLNKMSVDGWRLIGTATGQYEFEECAAGQYRYWVEYIANRSKQSAEDYAKALEDCGYRVFYKNANLNYSAGKVEYRPWAEEGGRIATEKTTLHKELLIIEKEDDGKAFELCASFEQRYNSYRKLRAWGLIPFLIAVVLGIVGKSIVWGIISVLPLVGARIFHMEIGKLMVDEKKAQAANAE